MCAICGCSEHAHTHEHGAHDHDHAHHHEHGERSVVAFERALLDKNDRLARANRRFFAERGVLALNLMSSPGAGKTTLLERTIGALAGVPVRVIEGDQATELDAERVRAAGARAVQINTGAGCHLDAHLVAHAAEDLELERGSLVLIENVGNLVCPALFDLGERQKVVIFSVTEGDDKPLKYPHMFRAADVLVVNKIDLLPYVSFDVDRSIEHARRLNPRLRVFQLSATRGDGMDAWCAWLRAELERGHRPAEAGEQAAR